ncbi:MAG: hypothetical protein ABSG97_06020 [Sedimentisphaerales bacterium]
MCRLIAWYLLERIVSVPTRLFMWLHISLLLKVTRTLREVRKAEYKKV